MTRYITRSKYTEDSSVKNITDVIKNYNCENNSVIFYNLTNTPIYTNFINDFIETLYDYREFLSYNSHMYIIEMKASTHKYDLYNMTINGKHLYNVKEPYSKIPVVALLSNDDFIIPIPIELVHKHNDYYGNFSFNHSNHDNYSAAFNCNIRVYDIGAKLFYCDYLFDDINYVIRSYSYKMYPYDRYEIVKNDIKIPPGLLDFISANRPSLEYFAADHNCFKKYKLPKFINCIKTNIKSILSENSPPELVKIFNETVSNELPLRELISHEVFEPKYTSIAQIKKEQAHENIQESEQAHENIQESEQAHEIKQESEQAHEIKQERERIQILIHMYERIQVLEQELHKLRKIVLHNCESISKLYDHINRLMSLTINELND